jgi:hypothetical protein
MDMINTILNPLSRIATIAVVLFTALSGHAQEIKIRTTDTLIRINANPKAGFNFDYYLYLPKGIKTDTLLHLVVETNNAGMSDSIEYHDRRARAAARNGVGSYVSRKMKLPFLVPVFPRPQTNWQYYTHALDRDALLCKDFGITRLDLQLISMVEDAKKQLSKLNYQVKEKFIMTGFSASGTFTNRFAFLHPDKLKAAAAGGVNGIVILPVNKLNGQKLNYPLGAADFQKCSGNTFNAEAFKALPQLYYMGELDQNDAVAFDDAYSKQERKIVYRLMGQKLIPDRWTFVSSVYKSNNVKAEFRTYPGIGHGTDKKINNELVDFFTEHTR